VLLLLRFDSGGGPRQSRGGITLCRRKLDRRRRRRRYACDSTPRRKKIGVGGLGVKWRVQGVFWKSDQWLAPWRVFVWKILPPPLAYSQVD
jgi:hypothetical protein